MSGNPKQKCDYLIAQDEGQDNDDTVRSYAETARGSDVILHGFFVDGVLRGVADLRILGREAEAAFSIEKPWRSHGVGSALLERSLLAARNRGVKLLQVCCLVDNYRMQQLARKFEAELISWMSAACMPAAWCIAAMKKWITITEFACMGGKARAGKLFPERPRQIASEFGKKGGRPRQPKLDLRHRSLRRLSQKRRSLRAYCRDCFRRIPW